MDVRYIRVSLYTLYLKQIFIVSYFSDFHVMILCK